MGWGIRVQLPQISFVPSQILCAQKNDKNKNISPKKMYFSPQTFKPGYGPGSAKIVSAIRIFCFEGHLASRYSITSTTNFCKPSLWGAGKHFCGGEELDCYCTGNSSKARIFE